MQVSAWCVLAAVLSACSTSAQPAKSPAAADVIATVGSSPITLADVDAKALQESAADFGSVRLAQALYLARRNALEEIIAARLIAVEASARGVTSEALVKKEIDDVATAPTEQDVAFWYQTNPAAVQGRPLDQLKTAIAALLTEQRMSDAHDRFVDSLKMKTPVVISLEPPRQQIATDKSPSKGPADAPIELVEFSDFQCPFCQRAHPTVEQVLKAYDGRIRFVYRHLPLPNHPAARPAAEASACAGEQGQFWPFHDRLFANPNQLTDAGFKAHAAALGLDTAKFNACVDGRQTRAEVDRDLKDANEAGVNSTPAFFINGRSIDGAQPFAAFKRIIDEELAGKK
jgi:protein-disulfide isomerase